MTTNNFIALTPNDIIIYNDIQSKIYKYFISFHKEYNSIDINGINGIKYCKSFKFDICLCHRNKNNVNNYPDIYKCPNNKRILYNLNNFNFLNPISINTNNNKIYPIDIFTYYRQEYLPFIINEEFNKYKNNQIKLKFLIKKKLNKYFNSLKNYRNNFHFLKYNFKVFKETSKKPLNDCHNDYLKNYYFNSLKNYRNNFHFLKYNFKVFKETSKKPLNNFHNDYLKNYYFNSLKNYRNNFHFLKYNFKVFKENYEKSLNNCHNDYLKNYYFNSLKNYRNNFHFLKYNFKVFKENYEKSLNKKIHISYNNNSYYNDLIDVFNKNPLNTSKTTGTQTEQQQPIINYSLLFAIILNDYTNLIGDYNDLIISLLKY